MAEFYEVLEELGSGSFGVVYRGIERATGEIVAIKHIDLESSSEDIQDIQQEISVLSTCNSPFVTQYKTSFLRGHKLWIIMEFLGGGSCLDLLRPGPFPEALIAIICRELLLGLEYLHQEGKIHRDIKAANILLAQSGQVKLADFGVAAQLTNIKSQRNTFVGTPFWMAPEVIQQSGYDFKADIWSLGITAMELIHGEPPNAATHPMKVLFLIPKAPAPRLDGSRYSREFRDFVSACLVKEADRRPSAKELLHHKFIKRAGPVSDLQELVTRRQAWTGSHISSSHTKYYEESMHALPSTSAQDEWVFETIKPGPAPTVRAPPASSIATMAQRFENLEVKRQDADDLHPTVQRRRTQRQSSNPSVRFSPMRRTSGRKEPLGQRHDSGNGGSRIMENDGKSESRRFSSCKRATMARRAYDSAVRPALQESVARSSTCQKKQEILERISSAWETMHVECPEEELALLNTLMERIHSDASLTRLCPTARMNKSPMKYALSPDNPHLKRESRRNPAIVAASESPRYHFPGTLQPGMEHTKQLADVLFSKWTESLRSRWPVL